MQYKVSYKNTSTQFIYFELTVVGIKKDLTYIRIPAWRPGRYELGNFAKNIRNWKAYDSKGNLLEFKKTGRERWEVNTQGHSSITIKYEVYAGLLNAGSTYLDEHQLYMNPVNCCCYAEGWENEKCEMLLDVPDDYKIATGLDKDPKNKKLITAPNFDQLADRPLIASPSLQHITFKVCDLQVNLWFQGECKPDKVRLVNDFSRFIEEQIESYDEFPEKEYHFLYQITPHKTHHGVEHENSTVCMIGPTYALFNAGYDEFLSLSSHEFYHSWNIKKIRPVEMLPYDLTKENYSRLGYVAEGVTTYYGDYMCYRSKVFNQEHFFIALEDLLDKHFHNYGRLFMPVAEASFDTWIDGYEPGVPHRKTSIYTEGALAALMTDIHIIKESGFKYSLDNVMHDLYHEYAKKGKGYTEEIYQSLIEKYLGKDYTWFFDKYINGVENFEPELRKVFNMVGLDFVAEPNPQPYEKNLGCKVSEENLKFTHIAPNSPAEKHGIMVGEQIASINNFIVTGNNLKHWFNYFRNDEIHIRVRTIDSHIRTVIVPPYENNYYAVHKMKILNNLTDSQQSLFEQWTKNSLGK
jgi:predicted metalloprotease with PDZ domain